ncbi:hypothetical protein STSP2_00949 [Anaerohalosphaera lusitana]|uniref:DNA methyltransferase n=1 Tax=Anaerohalosphaera lusitana TaxID=1936003 RepID=A0A1U9NIP4_9BACT|nr:hypothetical protein [Anaerohalosphaera lusitana]AQT67799.1 hypothetical protein STSP2_00949 [Anaerohalosphaera lusitana]
MVHLRREVFERYIKSVNDAYLKGDATEHTYRPAMQGLVEGLGENVHATNEPSRIRCGAPDFVVTRSRYGNHQTVGYIECKDLGADLRKIEKSEQIKKRYLPSLHNMILTDYVKFRWYVGGELRETAELAREGAGGKFVLSDEGVERVGEMLGQFMNVGVERIGSSKELAKRLGGMTRLMREIIKQTFEKESEKGSLHGQFDAFRKVLLHDLGEDEFADMYAQTIAYGLFAARCHINDVAAYGGKKGRAEGEKVSDPLN